MKILFITSRFPYPPHRGDKLRVYSFLREIARRHRIFLISFADHSISDSDIQALNKYCEYIRIIKLSTKSSWLSAGFRYASSTPAQIDYYTSRQMHRAIHDVSHYVKPDISYIHLIRMIQYKPDLPKDTYTILDMTDVISKSFFRHIPYSKKPLQSLILREAWRMRRYERWATTQVNEVWVISTTEYRDLYAAGGKGCITVIPNGYPHRKPIQRTPENNTLLFFGYAPADHNRDALSFLSNSIMPLVYKQLPNTQINVIGAGKPHHYVPYNNMVHTPGFVESPDDIFSRSTMLIAPIRFSAGMQNKIIEAMHAAVPVVTSPFGNEGIEGIHNKDMLICRTEDEFANAIINMIRDPKRRESIGFNGSLFVRKNFSWTKAGERIQAIEKIMHT